MPHQPVRLDGQGGSVTVVRGSMTGADHIGVMPINLDPSPTVVSANGWTTDPVDDRDACGPDGDGLAFREFSEAEARGLVSCIRDAAVLAEARRLAAKHTAADDGSDADQALRDLLALLSEER